MIKRFLLAGGKFMPEMNLKSLDLPVVLLDYLQRQRQNSKN